MTEQEVCPVCKGTGYSEYWAWNINTNRPLPVTSYTWRALPVSVKAAEECGQHWCQDARLVCECCGGTGCESRVAGTCNALRD